MANNAGVIQAELSVQIGTMLSTLRQAQAAVVEFGQAAGAGMAPAAKAAEGAAKSQDSLLQVAREYQKEQKQQGRMAKFWANEIGELIPAADEAKGAVRGLLNVGAEAALGGVGIGLALEGVKLLVSLYTQAAEAEAKARQATVDFSANLSKQTTQIWENVDALRARAAHMPEGEFEAKKAVTSQREEYGGMNLLQKRADLVAQIATSEKQLADRRATRNLGESEMQRESALKFEAVQHAQREADLKFQIQAIDQQLIAIEAQRVEHARALTIELQKSLVAHRDQVEADQRRNAAATGTERERIEAERKNRQIELERKYQEEKEKGMVNEYAYDQARANIDNEARNRIIMLNRATEAQNTAIRGQIEVIRAQNEVEKENAEWQAERAQIQLALNQYTIDATTATLKLQAADEKHLANLKAINKEKERRRALEAGEQALVGIHAADAQGEFETSGQDWLHKTPTAVSKEAAANATTALKSFNSEQAKAASLSATWGQTLGDALAGLATGTMTLGQVFAQVGQQIIKTLVEMAIQAVTANAASAAAGAAASQSAIPVVGPVLAISAMGAVLAAVLGLLGNMGSRAVGGSVWPGTYLVGEAGPELLHLGTGVSGSVVPNHRLALSGGSAGAGAGSSVNFTFNAPVDRAWWREQQREIMRTVRDAVRGNR